MGVVTSVVLNALPVVNCFEWVSTLMTKYDLKLLTLFFTTCWGLWNHRNSVLFDNQVRPIDHVVDFAEKYITEYAIVHQCSQIPVHIPRPRRWVVPLEGVFKLNFDGSVRKTQATAGIGIIVRDSNGLVIASMVEKVHFLDDVDCVEALGAVKALQFGHDLGLNNIQLEGDSLNVISAIQGTAENLSCYGHFVGVARALILQFHSSSVSHVYREGNCVAHCLSRLAFDFDSPRIWMEEVHPSPILDLLFFFFFFLFLENNWSTLVNYIKLFMFPLFW